MLMPMCQSMPVASLSTPPPTTAEIEVQLEAKLPSMMMNFCIARAESFCNA
jgi:hypothetical protein